MKVSDALLAAARDDEQGAIDMVNIWSHSSMAQKPSCPGPGFYTMGGARRLMQRMSAINPAQLFHTDFYACNAYANGEAAARGALPGAVHLRQQGHDDAAALDQIADGAIAARQVVQVDAGHQMMAEQPDAVLDALYAFAKGGQASYTRFAEFYPYYLTQHADRTCRRTHFIGSQRWRWRSGALVTANAWWILFGAGGGYGGAWIGHFGLEKNRPASFSAAAVFVPGDWVMYWQMLTGTELGCHAAGEVLGQP
jgi:hypothetical protein